MTAITKKKNTVKKKNPTKPGLYQILSANSRTPECALWDVETWLVWETMFGPHEWSPIAHCNDRVVKWARAGEAL